MKKILKKVKKAKIDDQLAGKPTPPEVQVDLTKEDGHEPSKVQGDHYNGGWSQWREEAEDNWSKWDWPPQGWRPQKWHAAYYDVNNPYHHYRYYNWDNHDGNEAPPPSDGKEGSPPSTPSTGTRLTSPDSQSTLVDTQSR